MADMTKKEWLSYYSKIKEDDCSLLDSLLDKSANHSDATEAMKFAQAAVSFTQAIAHKYELLLKRPPKGVWEEENEA